jgi:transcriptional regulator with PAS, ATPase and Fis domain
MENLLERLILTIEDPIIAPEHLPFELQKNMKESVKYTPNLEQDFIENKTLKEALEEVEIRLLSRASQQCKTTYEMAEYLGISQPSVMYKLKKYKDKLS